MSGRTALLAVLLPLALWQPVFADDAAAAPPAEQQPVAEKPGLMTRFAKLFDGLDTTKPENQHVFVIGGSHTSAQQATPADKPSGGASAAPVTDISAAALPNSTPAATPEAKPSTLGFHLKSGFDSNNAENPAPQ